MTHAGRQGRDWARQLAEQAGLPIDEIIDRILDHARAASRRGIFAPPGDHCEESRDLNAMLLHDGRIGIQVPAPDGEGDEHVVEARAFLERALQDDLLRQLLRLATKDAKDGFESATTEVLSAVEASWEPQHQNMSKREPTELNDNSP